ncbi:MAG: hypothetical protein K5785_00980 [Nitrosarchaeum sp.]|nr:hypothetical protein [Nitrosarchaeum sp.]
MTILTDSGNNTQAKRIQRIRDAADGVTTASVSDDMILEKLEKSDTWMEVMTNNFNWQESDPKWQTALECSENRAASKLPGILKETHDDLVKDYTMTVKALNRKDTENQNTGMTHIAEGINITNQLDPAVYMQDQDVFTNDY